MIHGARYLLNGNAPMRGHDCTPIRGALVVIIQRTISLIFLNYGRTKLSCKICRIYRTFDVCVTSLQACIFVSQWIH